MVIIEKKGRIVSVAAFCGIDWAEDHHDIALVDQDGAPLAKRRFGDDAVGFAARCATRRPGRATAAPSRAAARPVHLMTVLI